MNYGEHGGGTERTTEHTEHTEWGGEFLWGRTPVSARAVILCDFVPS